jgi:hypothetical protein
MTSALSLSLLYKKIKIKVMNTKQILYNALKEQLKVKEEECGIYDKEVYEPFFIELKTSIKEWFSNNIKTKFDKFEFTGEEIVLNTCNESWRDITIKMRGWDERKHVELDWSSDSIKLTDEQAIYKGILIGELAANFNIIENKFRTDWHSIYKNILNKRIEYYKGYGDLKSALTNLQNEIKSDAVESMKQIGFEIKKFKPYYRLNWNYNDTGKEYNIEVNDHDLSLQTGRAKYEYVYINGFKVLGKKGNKYQIETYRRDGIVRTYDILEKKMDAFINNVNEWENKTADEYKINVEKQYKERTSK